MQDCNYERDTGFSGQLRWEIREMLLERTGIRQRNVENPFILT